MKIYKVHFQGKEFRRRTEATYPYATYRYDAPLTESRVKFHKTYQAAARRSGLCSIKETYR